MSHPLLSNPAVTELIKRKARKLSRIIRLPWVDRTDLEQYLTLAVLEATPAFDPQRGTPEAFGATVIRRAASRFQRDRWVQKRTAKIWPVDVADIEDPQTERGSTRTDLRLVLAELIPTLTPDQQDLVRNLQDKYPAKLARETGIPASTLRSRIRALRLPFAKKYLEEFL